MSIFREGDKVVIIIPAENREWGYNPCPNGTVAEVIGFGEIDYGYANNFGYEPGVYKNKCWVRLLMPDNTQHTEFEGRLQLVDNEEEQRRRAVYDWTEDGKERLRDLPVTDFIEGDVVTSLYLDERNFPNKRAVISQVHYDYIGKFCSDNITPMPTYSLSDKFPSGWSMGIRHVDEIHLKLVERGNVWKYWHNEPIAWNSVEEQANFYNMLGQIDEIKNPASGNYGWTKDEAVDAIYNDVGDCISVSSMFGSNPVTFVKRFRDRELGEKVRQLTMKGFPRCVQSGS